MSEPTTTDAWIRAQPEAVHADLRTLDAHIRAAAPHLVGQGQPGAMLVYGPFRYRYPTGREGQSALVSIAVRSGGLSVYVNAVDGGSYVAEAAGARLGKAKVGRSCIAFRRCADLHLDVLEEVVRRAVEVGGAGAVGSARDP